MKYENTFRHTVKILDSASRLLFKIVVQGVMADSMNKKIIVCTR